MTCHVCSSEIAELIGFAQHDAEQFLALGQVVPDQLAGSCAPPLSALFGLLRVVLLAGGHDAVDAVRNRGLEQLAFGREVLVERARTRRQSGRLLDIGDRRRRVPLGGEQLQRRGRADVRVRSCHGERVLTHRGVCQIGSRK